MKRKLYAPLAATAIALLAIGLSGCSGSANSTASCAFIVGDGKNGNDAKLHKIAYPGQNVDVSGGDEDVSYIPCNSRNYIITNGIHKNANGDVIGDRLNATGAFTTDGVKVLVSTTAYWTLNEGDRAMRDFYQVCFKYKCASKDDVGGDTNFSTKGWNGVLGEDFGPSVDTIVQNEVFKMGNYADLWQNHDPAKYQALADALSQHFADTVRETTGFDQDLFCGSGNSGWKDVNNPGKGDFTCSPVRFKVDDVVQAPVATSDNSKGAQIVNQQRLDAAKVLYGPNAGYWLALQDTIDRCKADHTTCVFNMAGNGTTPVAVPTP